jgi:hypothetical protein
MTENTISYLAGGMLGDFINALSVVNEKYISTGKKGIVYLSEKGDGFHFGLEKAFEDTYPIVSNQEYIASYSIYNNEPVDIDLTDWRYNPNVDFKNWYIKFKETYQVEWGQHQWIFLEKACFHWEKYVNHYSDLQARINNKEDAYHHWIHFGKGEGRNCFNDYNLEQFKGRVLINTTSYRWPIQIDFALLHSHHGDKLLFIGFDTKEHSIFKQKTGLEIEFYKPKDLLDFFIVIQQCEMFVGSQSAPLHVAFAMHKNSIIGLCKEDYSLEHGHHYVKELDKIYNFFNF